MSSAAGLVLLAIDGERRRLCRGDSIAVEKNREDGSFDTSAGMEGRVAKNRHCSWRRDWESAVVEGAIDARIEAIISVEADGKGGRSCRYVSLLEEYVTPGLVVGVNDVGSNETSLSKSADSGRLT